MVVATGVEGPHLQSVINRLAGGVKAYTIAYIRIMK
jgi:cytochrome c2